MIEKEKVESLWQVLQEIATFGGVDFGAVRDAALLGCLHEINENLQELIVAAHERDEVIQSQCQSFLRVILAVVPEADREDLRAEVGASASPPAPEAPRDLRRTVDAHEIQIETISDAVQNILRRLDEQATFLVALGGPPKE